MVVVIGGIGSVSGSVIAAFIYYASSEWWLKFLDLETFTEAGKKIPLLGPGFRMVVFSVLIMIVVLFFRKGIMGTREISVYDWFVKIKKLFTKKKDTLPMMWLQFFEKLSDRRRSAIQVRLIRMQRESFRCVLGEQQRFVSF